jgi:TDG/mug DNA glycosylase family protein
MLEPARASDLPLIERWVRRFRLDPEDLRVGQFLVWRREGAVRAFGRIKPYGGGVHELGCLAVAERERGQGLGRRLARELIRRYPSPVVHVTTDLVRWFEPLGFRVAARGPRALLEKIGRIEGRLRSGVVLMARRRDAIERFDLRRVPPARLPEALARLHAELPEGTAVRLRLPRGAGSLAGVGGFERARRGGGFVRARTLPDLVGPGLRLLVCGLNPSLYSADAGLPFARPGNRCWPALRGAGLVARERDLWRAFARGIGFTDLVKRATPRSDGIGREEFEAGLARLEALVRRFRPRVVCLVGLQGFRAARDPRATAGPLAGGLGGRPAWLLPSTSGRNASATVASLAAHFRAAAAML